MTQHEILELRWKLETDPILTDEEIAFTLNAIERQHPVKVLIDKYIFRCSDCGRSVAKLDKYCWLCGQKLDWEE